MRGFAYAAAVVAAIGIAYVIASTGNDSVKEAADSTQLMVTATSVDALAGESGGKSAVELDAPPAPDAAQLVTVAVPDMMCAVSCFPRVQQALESDPTVQAVTLGPQREAGLIDNRQVIIQHGPGFEVQSALRSLAKAGFTENSVVQ